MTGPDLFPRQSGHFGQEFDMSDNPIALSIQDIWAVDACVSVMSPKATKG